MHVYWEVRVYSKKYGMHVQNEYSIIRLISHCVLLSQVNLNLAKSSKFCTSASNSVAGLRLLYFFSYAYDQRQLFNFEHFVLCLQSRKHLHTCFFMRVVY